jgi:hypothetical protein
VAGHAQATQVLSSLAFFTGIPDGDLAVPVPGAGGRRGRHAAGRPSRRGDLSGESGTRAEARRPGGALPTVTAFAAVLAFPFYWMLLATFKADHDLYDLKNNPLISNDPSRGSGIP